MLVSPRLRHTQPCRPSWGFKTFIVSAVGNCLRVLSRGVNPPLIYVSKKITLAEVRNAGERCTRARLLRTPRSERSNPHGGAGVRVALPCAGGGISSLLGGVGVRDRVVEDDSQVSDLNTQVQEGTILPRWGRPEISKLSNSIYPFSAFALDQCFIFISIP